MRVNLLLYIFIDSFCLLGVEHQQAITNPSCWSLCTDSKIYKSILRHSQRLFLLLEVFEDSASALQMIACTQKPTPRITFRVTAAQTLHCKGGYKQKTQQPIVFPFLKLWSKGLKEESCFLWGSCDIVSTQCHPWGKCYKQLVHLAQPQQQQNPGHCNTDRLMEWLHPFIPT